MTAGLSKPLAPIAGLTLGLFGVIAFLTATAQAPAIREDLQVEDPAGSTRVLDLPAMYDYGNYLRIMGRSYLVADIFFAAQSDQPDEMASDELRAARAARAMELLAESLRHDPANVYIWRDYTLSFLALDDVEGASAALARLHALAPTDTRLAQTRLILIAALQEALDDPTAHAAIAVADQLMIDAAQQDG